ncbi:unnamed protein product [Didymodactylos carnosus]|uniref:Potassium channel domain-containing protein n=1 Tax=Didymodactylos carnosus TaxID=1234261 RepID=A0A814E5Z4_9BILA|nr:unnamed protein product [Didymodactylos carnosus]CAF0966513.1 unnamed protein product [Didymodactylos carnosus]CAF3587198.1 unnamed protein product [Didymodactylos carnosus]CAF3740025.1 unnamed protein product [Didymodactylos carnosus]
MVRTYLRRVDSIPRVIAVKQNRFKKTKEQAHRKVFEIENMRRRQLAKEEGKCCTKDNCLTCCKKFTAFMFSRVGLFCVMIGYVAFGGWLFQTLESTNEQNMRRAMGEELNTTLYKLWIELLRVNSYPYVDKRGNFSIYASRELERFEAMVIVQVQQGFDGRTRTNSEHDWNFFGAILYAVTLISTIGYGHITTKTTQGKIATILYSAFGVPLMMLFVANIGSTMARMFRFVFSRITIIVCCRMHKKKRPQKVKSMTVNNTLDKLPSYTLRNTNIKTTPSLELKQHHQSTLLSQQNESVPNLTTKSSIKRSKDNNSLSVQSTSVIDENNTKLRFQSLSSSPSNSSSSSSSVNTDDDEKNLETNVRSLPADIRLNLLTGVPVTHKQRNSLTTSIRSNTSMTDSNGGGGRKKDAINRINELIRQNSVQDDEDNNKDNINGVRNQNRQSTDLNPIEFYINETLKLTTNLDNDNNKKKKLNELQQTTIITNDKIDEANMQKATFDNNIVEEKNLKKSSSKKKRKELKRSKSESTHNRKLRKNNTNISEDHTESKTRDGHHRDKTNSNNNDQDITVEKEASLIPPPDIECLTDPKDGTTTTSNTNRSFRKRLFSRKSSKKKTKDGATLHRQSSAIEFRKINETDDKTIRGLRKQRSFNEKRNPPSYDESNKLSELNEKDLHLTIPSRLTWSQNLQQQQSTLPSQLVYLDEDGDEEYEEQMSVPLLVTVFVIPLYLTLGAVLFNIWEEEWGFLNSFYFCFTTLTTIGFGDYVPGSSLTVAAKEKLISAALYILLGLVLIAMCFNLMKEQFNQKVKQIAGKLGILEC